MVIANRGTSSSTACPVLTGDSRRDRALWMLSSILAEIAAQAVSNNNDGSVSTEKLTHQNVSGEKEINIGGMQ